MTPTRRGLAFLATALALAGCTITLGRRFPAENTPAIVVGTTSESALPGLFGDPMFRRTLSADDFESTIAGWGYGTSTASGNKGHELHVETVDGVVNGYLFSSSLEPDSTDFDLARADALAAGRSTLQEAEHLMGPPDGRLRVPTNLLHDWFGPLKATVPPQGATQAIAYSFTDLAVQQDVAARRVKLLVLFAGPDGTITAVRRFDGTR